MPLIEYVYFIATGLVSGFIAGLLGLGGGILIVPLLLVIISLFDSQMPNMMQHVIATSLACILLSSFVSAWLHHKKEGIVWRLLRSILPGIIIGSIVGAYAAHLVPSPLLKKSFGGFLFAVAIYLFFRKKPKQPKKRQVHRGSIQSLMGAVISFLSSSLGIGGGTFYVPLFLGYKMPMKNAVATSSACTFFNALIGSFVYIILGWHLDDQISTLGYVYMPAFLAVGIGVLCTAPFGVKLAHKLPSYLLQRVFSVLLLCIAVLMFVR